MQVLSPQIDRLGAALRALRDTYDGNKDERVTRLGAKCLTLVIRHLAEEGLTAADLSSLIDLETDLKSGLVHRQQSRERRVGAPPSDEVLGRLAATIDLLVKAGYDEADAAQILTRKMIGAGITPPRQGGDARGWKRLLLWRADLIYGVASPAAKAEYKRFTAELDKIPPETRLKRVLDGQLWDRRRAAR